MFRVHRALRSRYLIGAAKQQERRDCAEGGSGMVCSATVQRRVAAKAEPPSSHHVPQSLLHRRAAHSGHERPETCASDWNTCANLTFLTATSARLFLPSSSRPSAYCWRRAAVATFASISFSLFSVSLADGLALTRPTWATKRSSKDSKNRTRLKLTT